MQRGMLPSGMYAVLRTILIAQIGFELACLEPGLQNIKNKNLRKPLQHGFTIPGGTHVPCKGWLLATLVLLLLESIKKATKH